jgi:DNA modification methylase
MSKVNKYTHNFFPYPAKFPPEPIREHLLKYSNENDTVLDPFCGSGTVLVEALLNNRNAIGIDLNPVSALISDAKSKIYTDEEIHDLTIIIEEIEEKKTIRDFWVYSTVNEVDVPKHKNWELWFKDNMLYEMTAIRKDYLYSNRFSENLTKLLWMAFLKIVVDVSNQEADTRYASVEKENLVNGFALEKFQSCLKDYFKVLISSKFDESIAQKTIRVFEGDVNEQINRIQNHSIDLVITSPPYINTFDYYLYHKHRIFWLDKDPQAVRRLEIGCHHRIDTMSFEKALNEYETNMENLIASLSNKLKKGKYFIMLIGDGIVKGELIKADELIRDICRRNQFTVEDIITTSFKEVSKGFIKGRNLDKKKHHTIIMKR